MASYKGHTNLELGERVWTEVRDRDYLSNLEGRLNCGDVRMQCRRFKLITRDEDSELESIESNKIGHNRKMLRYLEGAGGLEGFKTFLEILNRWPQKYGDLIEVLSKVVEKVLSEIPEVPPPIVEDPVPKEPVPSQPVAIIPLLGCVSMSIKDTDTCRKLADELRLITDPSFDAVEVIEDRGIKKPSAIATQLFKDWLNKHRDMTDEKREEYLCRMFVRMQRPDLKSRYLEMKPEYRLEDYQ